MDPPRPKSIKKTGAALLNNKQQQISLCSAFPLFQNPNLKLKKLINGLSEVELIHPPTETFNHKGKQTLISKKKRTKHESIVVSFLTNNAISQEGNGMTAKT